MERITDKRLIVSLTSYPARIETVHLVLETIYAQTRKADEIILWLASEQFPGGVNKLPEKLQFLIGEGRLTLRWCDDLKPHKKYFYALQEFDKDIVVTIDDDVLYDEEMLDNLYQSYLRYPSAVSTIRAHLITISEEKVMPYQDWIQRRGVYYKGPSKWLMAIGVGGVLYPPGIFRNELFDKETIIKTCLWADDLWLKAMGLICDVPVVIAQDYQELIHIPGTQQDALFRKNVHENQNDIQFKNIITWVDERYGKDFLFEKLIEDTGDKNNIIEMLGRNLSEERQENQKKVHALSDRINQLEKENRRLKNQLQALEQSNKVVRTLELIKKIFGQ